MTQKSSIRYITEKAGRRRVLYDVDVAVAGCPPTPIAIMQGILTAIASPRSASVRSDIAAR